MCVCVFEVILLIQMCLYEIHLFPVVKYPIPQEKEKKAMTDQITAINNEVQYEEGISSTTTLL